MVKQMTTIYNRKVYYWVCCGSVGADRGVCVANIKNCVLTMYTILYHY